MNHARIVRALCVLTLSLAGTARASRFEPMFLSERSVYECVASQKPVVHFVGRDNKGIAHTLQVLSDKAGQPLLFYADITTSVCIDNICQPARIGLYWDLVGGYVGFGVPPDQPLLKYDHVPFEPADYVKLHQVLCDRQSILGRVRLAEMVGAAASNGRRAVDRETPPDAVSRPTSEEIQPFVVAGAFYSCHTFWHLVHRDSQQPMADCLRTLRGPDLLRRFLDSPNRNYQCYAVEAMNAEQLNEHLPRVIQIIERTAPATVVRMVTALPDPIWKQDRITRTLYTRFASATVEMKSLLIQRMEQADPCAAEILVRQVEAMPKRELKGYLRFLAAEPDRLTGPIEARLQEIAASEQYAYCYVVDAFLRQ